MCVRVQTSVCCSCRPGDNHGYCSSGAVHFSFGEFCTTHLDQFYSPTQTFLRYTPFPTHLTIKPNVCCLHTWMCSVPANLTGTNPLRKWLSLSCSSVTSSSFPPLYAWVLSGLSSHRSCECCHMTVCPYALCQPGKQCCLVTIHRFRLFWPLPRIGFEFK